MSDQKTDKCKKCGEEISAHEQVCPSCGEEVSQGFNAKPWIILAIIILVIMEILVGRGPGAETKSEPAVEIVK